MLPKLLISKEHNTVTSVVNMPFKIKGNGEGKTKTHLTEIYLSLAQI